MNETQTIIWIWLCVALSSLSLHSVLAFYIEVLKQEFSFSIIVHFGVFIGFILLKWDTVQNDTEVICWITFLTCQVLFVIWPILKNYYQNRKKTVKQNYTDDILDDNMNK